VYDEKLSLGRIRDYDNMETKNVLNTVSTFFMTDDGGHLGNLAEIRAVSLEKVKSRFLT